MNIKTQQRIDHLVGYWICLLLTLIDRVVARVSVSRPVQQPRRVLIIKFWGMGSLMLASGGVQAAKKSDPSMHIAFLTLAGNYDFLAALSLCDEILTLDINRGLLRLLINTVRLIVRLRRASYDVVIDLEFFTRFSAIITYLSGAPVRAGFYDLAAKRGDLHTIRVPFNRYWHVKVNFDNIIARSLSLSPAASFNLARPAISDAIRRKLDEELQRHGIAPQSRVVAMNVNAGELAYERRWPVRHFAELAKRLLAAYPHSLVLIGSAQERAYVETMREVSGHAKVVNLSGQLTIEMLFALFERSRLLVTNDSGPLHLAAAMGTPTVSLFGPETPVLYAPPGPQHVVCYHNIDCSPCINVHNGKMVKCLRTSPECLENISVEEVFQRIADTALLK